MNTALTAFYDQLILKIKNTALNFLKNKCKPIYLTNVIFYRY